MVEDLTVPWLKLILIARRPVKVVVAVVVVEGHSAKSVAFASATVSFVNLDITPK